MTLGGIESTFKEPARETPPIERASNMLTSALDEFEQQLDGLIRRIDSVMGPAQPVNEDGMLKGSLEQSGMADFIGANASRVRSLTNIMADVTRRVEL